MKVITHLKDLILLAIEKDVNSFADFSKTSHSGTVELYNKKDILSIAAYTVGIETLSEPFYGNYDTPPHDGEYRVTIESINISPLIGENYFILSNITKALENALNKEIGNEI